MNSLLLHPSDVLFFRDGRPMSGGLAGHGAAWPLPGVTNAALHAALHRAGQALGEVHPHAYRHDDQAIGGARKFGSLLTAGPFPVRVTQTPARGNESWFFPWPADVRQCDGCDRLEIVLRPAGSQADWDPGCSSLPAGLRYAVAGCRPPAKETHAARWLEAAAFNDYLRDDFSHALTPGALVADRDVFLAEHTVGIGMNPDTGTQDGERIYSAHYLRLREDWRLGLVAQCEDKKGGNLIDRLFSTNGTDSEHTQILVGGQQRACSVRRLPAARLPLPSGVGAFERHDDGRCRVKWVLLAPAVWPQIEPGVSKRGTVRIEHEGGWLPTWVDPKSKDVLLRVVDERERKQRRHLNYAGKGYATDNGNAALISARLVAALVPKPIVVTGHAVGDAGEHGGQPWKVAAGARSTHLAVPAGAIYYFETEDAHGVSAEHHAAALAAALNWHGNGDGSTIKNRRSTLLGEKGYGLGVCGAWSPVPGSHLHLTD